MKLSPWLLALLSAVFASPAAQAADPVPGTPKWLCEQVEGAEWQTRHGACTEKDKETPAVAPAWLAYRNARQQCLDLVNAGVSQKRLRFDKSAATKCVAALKTYLLDPKRPQEKHEQARIYCAAAVEGLVEKGKTCDSALACKPGLACVGPKGAAPGTCREPLKLNTACDDDAPNGSRLYALIASRRPLCAAGLHCGPVGATLGCVKDKGSGNACKGDSPFECGNGLRCVQGTCRSETRLAVGAACGVAADCEAGLYCEKAACAPRKAKGSSCKATDECKGACLDGDCQAVCGSG